MWLNYRNGHMHPKSKRHATKSHATESEHAQEHWGKDDQQGLYMVTLFFSSFVFTHFFLLIREKILSQSHG
mgnify:CR=1 FL=1